MTALEVRLHTGLDIETGEPFVLVAVTNVYTDEILVPIRMTPDEAKETAEALTDAAHTIEKEAHLITSLRSRKFADETIAEIVEESRHMSNYSSVTALDDPSLYRYTDEGDSLYTDEGGEAD